MDNISTNEEKPFHKVKGLFFYWAVFFTAICYWELILAVMLRGSLSAVSFRFVLFALPQSLLLTALTGWGRDRLRRIVTAVLLTLVFAFYTAHLIYFRIFGSVISMSMLGVGGDALTDFGWATMVAVREAALLLVLYALPVIACFVWCFLKKPISRGYPLWCRGVAVGGVLVLWTLSVAALRIGGTGESSAYHAYKSALVSTDTASGKLGVLTTSILELSSMGKEDDYASEVSVSMESLVAAPTPAVPVPVYPTDEPETVPDTTEYNIIDDIDFSRLAALAPSDSTRALCEYLLSLPGTKKNDYTGLLEGYNLIYICAESFSNCAVSAELTPTLYKLANEGIVLTNYYNSYPNTTTNGEFAFMTGLWPDVSRKNTNRGVMTGSFGTSVNNLMPYGLGNVFAGVGVKSYAYHNYLGRYYGRNQTHPNLGYECRFAGDMEFSNLWPASDLEMMEQSVDDWINNDRFNVYYMTFSGHGPYNLKNNAITIEHYPKIPEFADGHELAKDARVYLANELELEWSMEYILQRLEEAGKLDNTLIVLTGDHYPYNLRDRGAESILGELPEPDFERYHSTCIMWYASEEPIECDVPCCNVDILPTVLNLLGLEFDSRLLSGTDIFSEGVHAAMLYNSNFITDTVKYNADTGECTWLRDPGDDPQAYADAIAAMLKARYAAALTINNEDFYRFVWKNSGLEVPGRIE